MGQGKTDPLRHSPDPRVSYSVGFMVVAYIVSEAVSAQNEKPGGQTDGPTDKLPFPEISMEIFKNHSRNL